LLFNQVAIAARYAQKTYDLKRVAIIDFDVHHGNGTQDIFWDDASVLYASTHQMPFFPGTGAREETGAGNIVNAPLSEGSNSEDFANALNNIIFPAISEFKPEFIFISAGFDAHWCDLLGGLELSDTDFGFVTKGLMQLADEFCKGRIVSVLEGGYDLKGLADSVAAHVLALMKREAEA
jgi:acetoin utilization deacetylase AcuC-like enzyme